MREHSMLDGVLSALRFRDADFEALRDSVLDWPAMLDLLDSEHLTLAVGARWGDVLPPAVLRRIQGNMASNAVRFERIREAYGEIAERFQVLGIEHVVLKGFSHWPCYGPDPRQRPQYDLDLWCRAGHIPGAITALAGLGYQPLFDVSGVPLDHAPPMVRKTGWRWRGDYFDPEMPPAVELHFRLWDEQTERLSAAGVEQFWERRTTRGVEDFRFPALDRADTVAYASMHLLRHLLRGDFRLYHAYELAYFLNETSTLEDFWQRWLTVHSEPVRRLQAIAFAFASRWFRCALAPHAASEIQALPEPVRLWFDQLTMAPVAAKQWPNKSELWLHLLLLQSNADRRAVLKRRLIPKTHATRYAAHIPDAASTMRIRVERRIFQARFTAMRLVRHARALGPTLRDGLRLWLSRHEIDPRLARFVGAAALFNFGLSVYFLLFNIFLVRRGFQEDLIGAVASAMSLGSIAGTLPGAFVLRRFGIRRVLVASFLVTPAMCSLRVVAAVPEVLIAAAFLGGLVFAIYAVAIPPVVAGLTTERSRRTGFSIVFAAGIGIGILAGLAGGRLPALLAKIPAISNASLEITLLAACAISVLGAIPAAGLILPEKAAEPVRHVYPSDSAALKFFLALLVWNIATGAFNPFFSVYFTKELGMQLGDVGALFSASQAVQLAALLMAPVVLRRLGVISGLPAMQGATALALAALAAGASGWIAGAIYTAYVASQYMTEPAIYSLLMERVAPEQRSGASAMNFLIVFGGQALAAAVSGIAVRRYGYRWVLAVAGLMALSAGWLMRRLLENRPNSLSRTVAISRT